MALLLHLQTHMLSDLALGHHLFYAAEERQTTLFFVYPTHENFHTSLYEMDADLETGAVPQG